MSENEVIEREVQRRMARQTRQVNDEIAELHSVIQQCQNDLLKQRDVITRLTNEPLIFGTLFQSKPIDPNCFKPDDEIIVIDPSSPHFQKTGKIIHVSQDRPVVTDDGYCVCCLNDETTVDRFAVGLEGKAPAQIKLSGKDDGGSAIVIVDGKPWEVKGTPGGDLQIGDSVKIKPDNKSIVSRGCNFSTGPICVVNQVTSKGVEVFYKGDNQFVQNPRKFPLAEGDRVVCDPTMFVIVETLGRANENRYHITEKIDTTWNDIGGLDSAVQEMRDALELPFQQPDLFKYYGIESLRGILLYGPPGCGKTLLARAAAHAVSLLHNKQSVPSSYIYVKGPEILDKWVGNTEREIRELFERGRRHFRQYGYKAVLAFDEADAIMPQRGMRRSSDVADTIVPMFLGEMDGVDPTQTEENPIVILMTNRADILDPAVTRAGRISRHIKIERPTELTAVDILEIHSKKIPFETDQKSVLMIAVSDLFSKNRLLYRVNNEHDFTLGDCVSGALLQNLTEIAKMNALHRDLKNKTQTGIIIDDFREGIKKVYSQQRGTNHNYDLEDFAERHGLQPQNLKIERCFGAC